MAASVRPQGKLSKMVNSLLDIKPSKEAYYKRKNPKQPISYYYQGPQLGAPSNNGIGPMY